MLRLKADNVKCAFFAHNICRITWVLRWVLLASYCSSWNIEKLNERFDSVGRTTFNSWILESNKWTFGSEECSVATSMLSNV